LPSIWRTADLPVPAIPVTRTFGMILRLREPAQVAAGTAFPGRSSPGNPEDAAVREMREMREEAGLPRSSAARFIG
jgi:hypothetical protein